MTHASRGRRQVIEVRLGRPRRACRRAWAWRCRATAQARTGLRRTEPTDPFAAPEAIVTCADTLRRPPRTREPRRASAQRLPHVQRHSRTRVAEGWGKGMKCSKSHRSRYMGPRPDRSPYASLGNRATLDIGERPRPLASRRRVRPLREAGTGWEDDGIRRPRSGFSKACVRSACDGGRPHATECMPHRGRAQ